MKKQISQDQIDAYKQKFGEIYQIDVVPTGVPAADGTADPDLITDATDADDNSDMFGAIFKRPSRKVLSMATSVSQDNPIRFNEVIAKNCFVDGDEEVLTNDDLFLSISTQLVKLIKVQQSKLKKL